MTEGTRPRLLIIAGPNGAGKTTITERGLAHEWFGGCEYINPDLVAQELGDWNDPETVLRAAALATERREACSGLGLGLAIALSAARANSGNLHVRDVPGKGCVFTIDLPRSSQSCL